jgi:chromosome segregation ATPase
LENNYIELLTQEKFLKYILQEPPLSIVETDSTRRELDVVEAKCKKYGLQIEELGQQIMFVVESIEAGKNKYKPIQHLTNKHLARAEFGQSADEITTLMDYITSLEEELTRIDSLLASSKSELTIDEAKTILNQQTEEMTRLTRTISEKNDSIADQQWRVEDLEEEVGKLDAKAMDLERKAQRAVMINQQKDSRVEKEYLE